MAKEKSKKNTSKSQFTKFVRRRRSYLIGVVLGITLITLNTVIGLFVVNLILDAQNPESIEAAEDLPVPKIDEASYETFRKDFFDRQQKELVEPTTENPFRTDI